jgi:hypothetical protein
LRTLTGGGEADAESLGGWLGAVDFSHGAAQAVAWLAIVLVVAVALAILVNELRIAGVLKVRGSAPRDRAHVAADPADPLIELERRDPREQPALLLELIADRLTEQGRLPPARALTTGELLRGARLEDESARTWLSELATACEQLRFSTRDFAGPSLASAIAAGRGVLARLEIGPPAHPAAAPRA